ncbi:F0F1 ATP synthase subunit C [Mycoplasma sp. 'Moose RK']|uniref:F0F1 ATP synthase subunit C n=1 Tax=Mycoplasma sp. 'Moose RK' TaxID=2780095 RepID=UPI0018C25AB3|nr:F0F1 ATP synthase subunit C [Mycoplasma sp. 'Moose RK']MBG0731007.1 F0F1 ATP synthase subunit C [Mycoplasma sp. 'Moose RK']
MNTIINFSQQVVQNFQDSTTTAITTSDPKMYSLLGAGIAMVGVIGTGAGQGFAVGKAIEAIGRNPEVQKQAFRILIIGTAISETSAIYALLIAFILIFVRS